LTRHEQLTLPRFIAVGPGRTGTSWLHAALGQVAWLPDGVKETLFFKYRYHKGIEWYAWHFRNADDSRPIGEVCPYFSFPAAIERIATHIPECKIVCTFRDPVERAYSSYRVRRRSVRLRGSFEEALASDPAINESNRYAFYLRKWQGRFGKEQVLATLYNDLTDDPQNYLDRICDFIGARRVPLENCQFDRRARNYVECAPRYPGLAWLLGRTWSALNSYRAHSLAGYLRRSAAWSFLVEGGEPYPPLRPEIAAKVRARFRPEVEALEDLIERDLSAWKADGQVHSGEPADFAPSVSSARAS
jgi:Sulfotransferase domain